jgi:hypothetical protein
MNYSEEYQQLKELYTTDADEIFIPDSPVRILNFEFQSRPEMLSGLPGYKEDRTISENLQFRYPVFVPDGKNRSRKAIVFLHGLNERNWYKHLAGAKRLSEKTGKAVIMFPLSFHINRGMQEWTNTRKMAQVLETRKQKFPGVRESSIVNLALSERLTQYPQRFFTSGMQSAMDLVALLTQIRKGVHPLFEVHSGIDIFAYSISCMLLQTLMISDESEVLRGCKIVFFAGGSIFSHLQGVSKFIMDSVAFDTIQEFYAGLFKKEAGFSRNKELQYCMMEHNFGKAFGSVLSPKIRKKERENGMAAFSSSLMVIALRDDKIIPLEGIKLAMGEKFCRSEQFSVVHFPYPYIHENPFPVLYRKIEEQVEQSFRLVYDQAIQFFTGNRPDKRKATAFSFSGSCDRHSAGWIGRKAV